MSNKTGKNKIRVLVEEPCPDIETHVEEHDLHEKRSKTVVQVGEELSSEDLEIISSNFTLGWVKAVIPAALAFVAIFQQVAYTIYAWCFSEKMLLETFTFSKYLIIVVFLWAIGQQAGSKITNVVKEITRAIVK